VVCGSPAYFAERGMPKVPGELAGHDCITFEGLMSAKSWSFGSGRSLASVAIHSRLVVNTAEAAVDAPVAGAGVTRVLSYQIAPQPRSGALAVALQEFEPALWPISLVHAGQGRLPLKLRAFLDFAVPRLRASLSSAMV